MGRFRKCTFENSIFASDGWEWQGRFVLNNKNLDEQNSVKRYFSNCFYKEKSYFKDWEINIDVLRCRAAYCAIF